MTGISHRANANCSNFIHQKKARLINVSTKEDILEQLVEEFLIHRGYFVRHNVKFLPRKNHPDFDAKLDSNHSDIDVLAYNPSKEGSDRVWAVSCKSWQAGFNPATKLAEIEQQKIVNGREAWKGFRELVVPKWSEAFVTTIQGLTGTTKFTYVTAVTKLTGSAQCWEEHSGFRKAMASNPVKIITLAEMMEEVYDKLGTTLAGTDLGRTLQLFRAAGFTDPTSTLK